MACPARLAGNGKPDSFPRERAEPALFLAPFVPVRPGSATISHQSGHDHITRVLRYAACRVTRWVHQLQGTGVIMNQPPGDMWPQAPQQGYGQQYPQDQPWQPQQYDPAVHQQHIGAPQPPYPPQGQPWPQPGYGQQPYPGQPQYAPGPFQPPPHRKRHTVRNILLAGFGGLVVVIIAVAVANSGGHTVNTTGTSSGSGTSGGGGNTAVKTQTAKIGSVITLSGNDSGEQMTVTVTKVISSASPGDEITAAPAGDRLYAVQFQLHDTGSAAYSDSPSNGAEVVDSAGQSYQASITDTAAGCTTFPASENIAPGSSGLGCIVFEVPKAAKVTAVQFTLDSGMGPQTGQWSVG